MQVPEIKLPAFPCLQDSQGLGPERAPYFETHYARRDKVICKLKAEDRHCLYSRVRNGAVGVLAVKAAETAGLTSKINPLMGIARKAF